MFCKIPQHVPECFVFQKNASILIQDLFYPIYDYSKLATFAVKLRLYEDFKIRFIIFELSNSASIQAE